MSCDSFSLNVSAKLCVKFEQQESSFRLVRVSCGSDVFARAIRKSGTVGMTHLFLIPPKNLFAALVLLLLKPGSNLATEAPTT